MTGTSSKAWSICGARVMVLFHGLRLRETLRAHPLEQRQGALPRQATDEGRLRLNVASGLADMGTLFHRQGRLVVAKTCQGALVPSNLERSTYGTPGRICTTSLGGRACKRLAQFLHRVSVVSLVRLRRYVRRRGAKSPCKVFSTRARSVGFRAPYR